MSVISVMAERLDDVRSWPLANLDEGEWLVKDAFLTIDFAPFFKSVKKRIDRLAAARRSIEINPEILSGTPVIRGTRIPAHDIAASVASGISTERILNSYPGLNAEAIELAVTYAEAHPIRGRPRGREAFPGYEIVTDRRIPRRRKAE
jgi:uncharacterized protein (DUF433 family)